MRIFFMSSSEVHHGAPHEDPLPEGPIDVVLLAIPSWDTKNADKEMLFLKKLNPTVVMPHHYDDCFWDWKEGCFVMESANLPLFFEKSSGLD